MLSRMARRRAKPGSRRIKARATASIGLIRRDHAVLDHHGATGELAPPLVHGAEDRGIPDQDRGHGLSLPCRVSAGLGVAGGLQRRQAGDQAAVMVQGSS
jgi:hypothetical protein